jgi:transposase
MRRTAVINQIRSLLLKRGITLRKGRCYVSVALPRILEDADAKLSGVLRMLLAQLKLELDHLEMRIDEADALIKKTAGENEACQRLVAIPGIGPVTGDRSHRGHRRRRGLSTRGGSSPPGWG